MSNILRRDAADSRCGGILPHADRMPKVFCIASGARKEGNLNWGIAESELSASFDKSCVQHQRITLSFLSNNFHPFDLAFILFLKDKAVSISRIGQFPATKEVAVVEEAAVHVVKRNAHLVTAGA